MPLNTVMTNPAGVKPTPQDILCRGSGNSQSIAAGDLVVFDFVNATSNDPDKVGRDADGQLLRNGWCSVMKVVEATHRAGPNLYGVALGTITTDSSGNPTSEARVRIYGIAEVLCDVTGITKGLGVMPSDATAGSVELLPVVDATSAATLEPSFRACLGVAMETKASGLGKVWFDGQCLNGRKIA